LIGPGGRPSEVLDQNFLGRELWEGKENLKGSRESAKKGRAFREERLRRVRREVRAEKGGPTRTVQKGGGGAGGQTISQKTRKGARPVKEDKKGGGEQQARRSVPRLRTSPDVCASFGGLYRAVCKGGRELVGGEHRNFKGVLLIGKVDVGGV